MLLPLIEKGGALFPLYILWDCHKIRGKGRTKSVIFHLFAQFQLLTTPHVQPCQIQSSRGSVMQDLVQIAKAVLLAQAGSLEKNATPLHLGCCCYPHAPTHATSQLPQRHCLHLYAFKAYRVQRCKTDLLDLTLRAFYFYKKERTKKKQKNPLKKYFVQLRVFS